MPELIARTRLKFGSKSRSGPFGFTVTESGRVIEAGATFEVDEALAKQLLADGSAMTPADFRAAGLEVTERPGGGWDVRPPDPAKTKRKAQVTEIITLRPIAGIPAGTPVEVDSDLAGRLIASGAAVEVSPLAGAGAHEGVRHRVAQEKEQAAVERAKKVGR
jgi:hypothetical protein